MMHFHGGPAHEASLGLSRAPLFLRVVIDQAGKVDALDQLEDRPRAGEMVYVYRRTGDVTHVHLQMAGPGGRGRRCRWELFAQYQIHEHQPSEATLRDQHRWQEWAQTEAARLQVEVRGL